MADDPDQTSDAFEALLRQARFAETPDVALVQRVLADAAAVQAQTEGALPVIGTSDRKGGWLRALVDGLGGWPAASGVALAGVAGLSFGFFAPDWIDSASGGHLWTLTGGAGATPEISSLLLENGDV